MSDNMRNVIGLSGAEEGDVFGALTFVQFMHRELSALSVADELPGIICDRLRMAGRDMEVLASFIEGYAEAHSFTPPPSQQP